MDEYDRGMDPRVQRYFRKIINSFSFGLMWLLCVSTAGLFFGLGIPGDGWKWYNLVFYGIAAASFAWLLYYYYKTWSSKDDLPE